MSWTESCGSWWAPIGTLTLEMHPVGETWHAMTWVSRSYALSDPIPELLQGSGASWDAAQRDLYRQLRLHDPVAAEDLLKLSDPRGDA